MAPVTWGLKNVTSIGIRPKRPTTRPHAVVPETQEHEARRASKSLFSDSMSNVANISISRDSEFVSQSVEPDNTVVDSEQSEYFTAKKTLVPQPIVLGDHTAITARTLRKTKQ